MPTSVRILVGLWVLMVALIVGVPLAGTVLDWAWPWADQPHRAFVHFQNNAGTDAVLRVTTESGLALHRDGSLLSNPYHELIGMPGGSQQVRCRVEFPVMPAWLPVDAPVPVAPGDHIQVVVGADGKVSLTRGHESWLGYPVYDSPPVALASR